MTSRIRTLSVLILCLCLALTMFSIATVLRRAGETCLLMRFKPGVDQPLEVLGSLGLEVVEEIPELDIFLVRAPTSLQSVEHALSGDPRVDLVEENLPVAPAQIPNDQYYGFQWHLHKIGAPDAWNTSQGSPNTVIAILDSGVDSGHADLAPKLLSGWNFYDNNSDTSDLTGHGTAVAGTASAMTNNSVGVASIGWKCSILPVRVTNQNGYAYYYTLAQGLTYAADRGAKMAVISFEINGGAALSSAAKYFEDKGGLVFAAGGNTGGYVSDSDNPYIISVSGTTSADQSIGSYGPYIDLSAPCSAIYTTIKGGGYGNVGGTSFAAPLAAGLAALMLSANQSLSPAQVEHILESTAVDLGDSGYDQHYGWGRINASYALRTAVGSSASTTDSTPPNVTIYYPNAGTTVSGGVTVDVNASDNVAVSEVDLYVDGQPFANDTVLPYDFYWNTAGCSNGNHTLMAEAHDPSNNVGQSSTTQVTVSNVIDNVPPTVTISNPPNGTQVSKSVNIQASAMDNSGISKVEFYVDGVLKGADTATPYAYSWNTKSLKDGWHAISVKAYDSSGNCATASVSVYVRNKR